MLPKPCDITVSVRNCKELKNRSQLAAETGNSRYGQTEIVLRTPQSCAFLRV